MYKVYFHVDPRSGRVRYVGITTNMYRRFLEHIRCNSGNVRKDAWIQELKDLQLILEMPTIETVATFAEARERERYWISYYLDLGVDLLNEALPGMDSSLFYYVGSSGTAVSSGRERTFADVIDMLETVREVGIWPEDISLAMQRYYRRKYAEFFGAGDERLREERLQKAARLKLHPRPSRKRA